MLSVTSTLLTACLGGTIAQQIARSIATSIADSAVATALDVQEIDTKDQFDRKPKSIVLKDTVPDPYLIAFANARFEPVKPIAEPLPEQLPEIETPIAVAISSQLVRVELFNLLIGEEKDAVYAKAQLMGATTLPKPREWKLWQVATGQIKTESANAKFKQHQQFITFLIPPEFGKLPSGSVTLVELANPGELNIARYKVH
ncbi:MAG: hypothetical protein V4575_10010 [Pseudomonadota bacterium]